nr:symplekin isoform X1 [Tanacetum cinerariifolium]
MAAPVISLTDEQKDHIQKLAFTRIVEANKHIAVAGGSQLRFSLLSYLGVEFPLELDPWSLLHTHILSDYTGHEGHELTLRVLFRLFGVAEADHDFFSSTTATSVYEIFLLKVAETLRDSFVDKQLLSEVPYLPKPVLKLLESLCVLRNSEKDAELHNGERVHQGLSIVWSLILLRPPTRDVCLKIALQSAVHRLEEVQTKAISKDNEMGKPLTESVSATVKDSSSKAGQASTSDNNSSTSIIDAQRCMSLYFALCTKVVQTLTDGAIPSPNLIDTIIKLYDTKLKDTEILIPILPFLPKDELLQIFPRFVNLPSDKFQAALARILQESSQGGSILTPAEVLIGIHGIDPEKDGIPLKKVIDACNTCFQQRQVFTQQVLAKVLNQLVEQIPLPMMFMRTVIQTIGAFPALVDFIMEILSRLVSKQIWKNQRLWVGFLKCAQLTKPQSFGVLLQLPPAQLEIALTKQPVLKGPLVSYASQPDIRTSLPRFDK